MGVKRIFRGLFIIGLLLAAISLFLDWYILQVFDMNDHLLIYWSYTPLFDWYSAFESESIYNDLYRPENSPIPFIFNIIYLISLTISFFGVILKDIEQNMEFQKLRFYSYVHIFIVLCTIFYICAFPIWYLIPNNLYFPFIQVYDPLLKIQFLYTVHIGYIFQVISLILLFPYTVFYYQIIITFEKEAHTPEKVISKYIEKLQEPLDLDKYIREEELKLTEKKVVISSKSKSKVK